jgi:hypothetical protein
MNSLSSNFDFGITTHTQRDTQTAKLRNQRPMNSAAGSHDVRFSSSIYHFDAKKALPTAVARQSLIYQLGDTQYMNAQPRLS